MPPDVASDQHDRMQGFVAALLRHEGALVEPINPEGLEVLAPPAVQHALGIGELTRLVLSRLAQGLLVARGGAS